MRLLLASALATFACSGTIDGATGGGDDSEPPPAGMVDIEGPQVLSHVQVFANAACTDTGACTISTYEGHQPTASRALDILASDVYGEVASDGNALGDEVAAYALAHQAEHGITYVIWRQRINLGDGWKAMEDRGSITQNHFDHVHVSFDEMP
jgi:peptidoglycan DL-endopeptidase CwlO